MTVTIPAEEEVNRVEFAAWCEESDLKDKRLESAIDSDRAFAIACATEILFKLTLRKYRYGRLVVRPTAVAGGYGTQSYLYPYSSMSGYGAAWGFAAGWSWTAVGMGWWQNGQDLSEVVLQGPVRRINQVLVGGVSLGGWPPTNPNFTLYDGRRLIRNVDQTSETASAWPWNQQMQLPLTEPGTWMIDYEFGRHPTPMGKFACIELATQMALAGSGQESAFAQRVTEIASQGITVMTGDPMEYIRSALTSLPLVDLFLMTENPHGFRRRTVMMSPNSTINREITGGVP